jgi:hypothetical protein
MPDTAPLQLPSYAVEVPQDTPSAASTYLRIGAPDETSSRERDYYGDKLTDQKPGIAMWSPGDLKLTVGADYTMKTAGESLSVTWYQAHAVNIAYTFTNYGTKWLPAAGSPRDVTYKLTHSTAFNIGDSQTWKIATNTDMALSVDQKIAVGFATNTKVTTDLNVSLGLLAIAANHKGVDVKDAFGHAFNTKRSSSLSGAEKVELSVTPLVSVILGRVEYANKLMLGVTAALATAATLCTMTAAGGLMFTQADGENGKYSLAREDLVKDFAMGLSVVGLSELALFTIVQVLYSLLGVLALTFADKPDPAGLTPSIKLDATGIVLQAGGSEITIGTSGIKMKNLAESMSLSPTGMTFTGTTASLTAGTASLLMGPGIVATAPNVELTGTVGARFTSANVQFPA